MWYAEQNCLAAGVCQLVCQPTAAAWFHVYINLQLKISYTRYLQIVMMLRFSTLFASI